MGTTPRVFISYSHDSDEHRERVLALSERLRQDGIPTDLDRYVNGTPKEGWPRWMLDRLDEADRVLVVCTETYYRRFRGHEVSGKGKGVDWEGAVITQAVYDARSSTTRFVPVLFDAGDEAQIPEPVRGQTRYCLTSELGYRDLCDALLGQAGVEPGPIGDAKHRPRTQAEPLTFAPLAPTLRVGVSPATLCVATAGQAVGIAGNARPRDAERPRMHPHAERGDEGARCGVRGTPSSATARSWWAGTRPCNGSSRSFVPATTARWSGRRGAESRPC